MQAKAVTASRSRPLLACALALCVVLLASNAVSGHPHAWIDLRTALVMTAEKDIIAIELEWLFDPIYSTLLIDDVGSTPEALLEQATGMLSRLDEYNYFTEIRVDDQIVSTQTVKTFENGLRSGRYWVRFLLPLETPVDPSKVSLGYAVFDPTYYIEILHLEEDIIEIHGDGTGDCFTRIVPPNPSAEAIIRARSPEVDKSPDQSLGALFAERVEVECR